MNTSVLVMDTVSLSEVQRARAKNIKKRLSENEIRSPTDVVDDWQPPNYSINWSQKESLFPQYEGFISTSKIKGTLEDSINRLNTNRLENILELMLNGEFEKQNKYPPDLQKRGEYYYVAEDGHHRCMAAKAVGLDQLYAEYEVVPPNLLE